MYYKTRQIWVYYFVCTLLLYTKVSASKVHSYTSTELGLSTSVSEGVREKTCSGIASVNHGAPYVVVVVSSVSFFLFFLSFFCSGEGKSLSVHCFLYVNSPSKVPFDIHPSCGNHSDSRLVSQWVQNKNNKRQDTNRNDTKTRGREDLQKTRFVLSPSSFFSSFLNVTGLKK